jgi:group I intron endonuclease
MLIYKVTNTINDKIYIGQTIRTLKLRKQQHLNRVANGSDFHFHNALRKYGNDKFIWDILDTAETQEELDKKEQYWIKTLRAMDYDVGYNLREGKENGRLSEESKAKIRQAAIGRKASAATKLKMSLSKIGEKNSFYGKKHTAVTKAAISKTKTGVHTGKPWNKGIKYSEERIRPMSANAKKGWAKRKVGITIRDYE